MAKKKSPAWFRKNAQQYFYQGNEQGKNNNEMPTINGLALALGFCSKEELFDFKADETSMVEVKLALTRLEEIIERALYEKEKYQAAKFILTNHFVGWSDKAEKGEEGSITIIDDIGGA